MISINRDIITKPKYADQHVQRALSNPPQQTAAKTAGIDQPAWLDRIEINSPGLALPKGQEVDRPSRRWSDIRGDPIPIRLVFRPWLPQFRRYDDGEQIAAEPGRQQIGCSGHGRGANKAPAKGHNSLWPNRES